jgi:hypothetical protein
MNEHHVLGISGGKDSAALAVYMSIYHPEIDITYFFTDTGKELPEVYEFLGRLEGVLGKKVLLLNPDRDFDFWLREYNQFLPSPRQRWCTRQLKLLPFKNWVQPWLDSGDIVNSYVAIRADENSREGFNSTHDNLKIHFPFRTAGIDHAGVLDILQGAGIGLPKYYDWRSRSGCTFCFYQQKIEWVRLKEHHPEAFEEAKRYEKNALDHGSKFTWSERESLEQLEQPGRVKQIEEEHAKRLARIRATRRINPLHEGLNLPEGIELEDELDSGKVCITCHK